MASAAVGLERDRAAAGDREAMALRTFGSGRFIGRILSRNARRVTVRAAHPRLHPANLMDQMELVLDRVRAQSLRQAARFPLRRRQSLPDPLAINYRIPHSAPVWYAKHAPGFVSESYSVDAIVTARTDPICYEGCMYV